MIIYREGKKILEIKDFKVVGKFMEVATLDCTIKSPTPIEFKIGDYVVYDYNGLTYSLYDIPTPKKQARSGSYGEAFIYELKFKSNMEQLSICPFLDMVANDNGLHYTSLPSFSTFENVYGIATRVQANMDYLYPNKWRIVVADTDDPELLETLNEAKDFSISGQSCLEGLKKVYKTWGVGFIHTVSDGLNIITIGKSAGTTSLFRYGKGQGLRTIKKSLQNSDQFCTRVYAYGSTRNIPARWYNDKGYIGEAQYAPCLMIPPSKWADGKPQGAYIDAVFGDEDRVKKYGLRIKTFSYDGSNGRDEIFPSIEKVTAGNIRTAKQELGETKYTPSAAYSDAERMDYILEGSNIEDDGTTVQAGYNLYSDSIKSEITPASGVFVIAEDKGDGTYRQLSLTEEIPICRFNITKLAEYKVGAIDNILTFEKNEFESTVNVEFFMKRPTGDYLKLSQVPYLHQGSAQIVVPLVESEFSAAIEGVYTLVARVTVGWSETYVNPLIPEEPVDLNYTVSGGEALVYRGAKTLKSTFTIKLKQIGFDLNTVKASDGSAKTISFKSGMCSGRSFVITRCEYSASDDSWVLTCRRGVDSSVSQTFPNSIFPIASGDQFILLNINMPDLYVHTAMQRLYDTALADLKHYSNPQFVVSPEIDNLQMARSPQTLKEGMYMPVEDADINIDDDILIDGVTITEKGNELRRFDVTLRNDKIYNRFSKIATSLSNLESSIEEAKKNANNTPLTSGEESVILGGSSPQISIWEHINVGTEENPKYAIVPKQYKGEDVGIVSDTFITAGGVNSSASSSAFYNRLDRWDDYDETDGAVLSAVLGYVLKSDIEGLDSRVKYLEQNSGGSGNVNEAQLSAYLKKTEAEALYAPLTLSTKVNSIQESLETHVLDFNNFKNVTYAKHLSAFNTFKSEVSRRLDELESFWVLDAETNSIKTTYNVLGALAITAGGVRDEGSTDGLYNRLDRWEDYDATSGDVLSAVLGYDLNTRIERLERNNGNVSEEQLEAYLKKNDAASMYVPIARFEDLNTKVSSFLEGTDDNNIIDKWRELESFLAGQTETSTLAELLAVKADRSALEQLITRVATAEGSITINKNNIATNLASINVLNGYFTSGSANNALQLGGQLPAYYATKAALDTVTGNLNTHIATYNTFVNSTFANFKADTQARLNALEGLWAIDDANDGLYPKDGRGIYSESYVTSGGVAGSVGNVIFTRLDDWDNYDATAGDVLSAKLGYELKQLIGSSSGSSADLSAYVKKAELTSELGNYVKTSTLTSTLSSYVLTTTLNTVLGNYVQTLALNSKLNGYQTLLSTSNKLPTSYISGLASVATSGSYNDLSNKPTIPSLAGYAKESWVTNQGYITRINKSMVVAALDYTPYDSSNPDNYITSEDLNGYATQSWVKARGYITGIDDGMISNALGYTPYDASNPNGYITGVTTSMVASALKGATISGALTVSGAFYAGSITHGSDMRYKSKLNDIAEDINVIADAPFFDFVWKGEDEREYIGTSAQYWLTTKFNNAVLHDKKKDFYSLAYGELGVGIGIINSRAIVSHEERIKVLEAENAALKTELNTLNRRIALWQH